MITGVSAVVWLSAMLLTPPETEAVLETFIRQVQPPGPGWARLRQRFQVEPQERLSTLLARFVYSCGVLFGGLIGIGGFLLHQQFSGWGGLVMLVGSWLLMHRLPQQNGARMV